MMFIILDKDPKEAVEKLCRTMNDRYCFKQLIELGQLICSAGISDVYKPIPQGKTIQEWIKQHPWYVAIYYTNLLAKYLSYFKSSQAMDRAMLIRNRIIYYGIETNHKPVTTAIFRYSNKYTDTIYKNNSEIPITAACREYNKYIKEYKFKENKNGKSIN